MERKQIIGQDVFQESFDSYLAILESLNEGVQICELIFNDKGEAIDYILRGYNKIFERILNLARRDLLGKKVKEFVPELTNNEFLSIYKRAVKSKKVANFETYSISADRWFSATVLSLKEKNWFAVIFRDITRSRKAETILKQSKEKYQNLIETINDVIWETDAKGHFTFCSPQLEKLWGIKPKNVIGKSVFGRMPAEYKEKASEFVRSLTHFPKPFNGLEMPFFDNKGRLIFSEVNGVPFFDNNGKLLGWRGITRDITDRKKAEEASRRSEQHLRLHTRNSPLAVIDWDSNFVVTRWSGQAEKMFGWTAKEMIGKGLMDLHMVYEPDIPLVKETIRKLTSGNIQVISSNRNVSKNGKILFCTWYSSVLLNNKGKMDSVMSLVEDNTARVEAEEALKRSEQHYRQLFSSMTEMFEVIEPVYDKENKMVDFIYRELNPALERFLGKSREELINKKAKDFNNIIEDHWLELYAKIAEAKEPLHYENYGAEFGKYYDVHTWKLKENLIALIISDVTKRKQLEKQLENYTKNLEVLVEERTKQLKDSERLATIGATAGMVGHDIRNPLQAIVGDLYLTKSEVAELSESEIKQNIKENLEAIEQNIEYINKIVLDLQDFARPISPNIKKVNLESIIVASLQSEMAPKNIKSYYHIDEKAKIIFTDQDLLKRILNNLGLNAIQAMPDGGKIFVTVSTDNENTVIAIEDSGVGIPDEIKPKLFTPMITTKAKGQGFGLATVKRMTEALGGSVTFESKVGKGTKFIIKFPKSNEKITNEQAQL